MGDNKISDEVIRDVFLRNGFTIKEGQADLKPYVYAAARELIAHLQGEAVPVVYGIRVKGNSAIVGVLPIPLKDFPVTNKEWDDRYEEVPLYLHPQPAELSEAPDLIAEAVAVGDGTLHGAITYWHQRALSAEAKLNEVSGNSGELEAVLRAGLQRAKVSGREYLHLLKPSEIDALVREALAATGKQQVGEVQGSREQFEAWAAKYGLSLISGRGDYHFTETRHAWSAWQAALAPRQPVGAHGIDLGPIRVLLQSAAMFYDRGLKGRCRGRIDDALALIDGRDAGTGVGS